MLLFSFFHSQVAVQKSFIVASREDQMGNIDWMAFCDYILFFIGEGQIS